MSSCILLSRLILIADVLLPDGTNVNHALVKEGWC